MRWKAERSLVRPWRAQRENVVPWELWHLGARRSTRRATALHSMAARSTQQLSTEQRSKARLFERLETYSAYLRPLYQDGSVWMYEIVAWPS